MPSLVSSGSGTSGDYDDGPSRCRPTGRTAFLHPLRGGAGTLGSDSPGGAMAREPAFEREVQALARRIAEAGHGEHAHVFRLGGWSERMLDWALANPDFKTQLFRLVDVLPSCTDDADVLRHVEEYFEGVAVPRALDLGIDLAEHVPFGAQVTASVVRRNVRRMARQFIAGETPAAALPRLARLWQRGEASTVDLLGEHTVTDDEADEYARRVLELLDALVTASAAWPARPHLEHDPWGSLPRADVSVKPSALSPLFGPLTAEEGVAAACARLEPVLRRAAEADAAVHLDTEHDESKDLTFAMVRALGTRFPDVQLGCVVQAYRKDAHADLRDLVDWSRTALRRPLRIRLVKGAYWDAETLVSPAVEDDALPAPAADPPPPRPPTDPATAAPFANEPLAELRRPGPRARLAAAVSRTAGTLGFGAPVRVDGKQRAGNGDLVSLDPSDATTVVCRSGLATPAD